MTDPYADIIVKALKKARRPLSTSKVAKKTQMDWVTAKSRLTSLKSKGEVHGKTMKSRKLWSIGAIREPSIISGKPSRGKRKR